MSGTLILTPEQLDEFGRRGVLRLSRLLAAEKVRAAREYVQRRFAQSGLPIGNKHPDVEALVCEPALLRAVETLLGGCTFDRELSGRPQVLFTLPSSIEWTVPRKGWHVDIPRLTSGRRPGVQLFTFLDTVECRGGGTLVVAGSHRLLNDGRFIRSRDVRRLLGREAFFRELYSQGPGTLDDRADLLRYAGVVRQVALEVVELTGEPGDAYLTDLRVLHAGSPNTSRRPRIMATHRFVREEVRQELREGYGWEE